MKEKDPHELLTFEEIRVEFSEAINKWKWDNHRLNVLRRSAMIVGDWDNTTKQYVYKRGSIMAAIDHANAQLDFQRVSNGRTGT